MAMCRVLSSLPRYLVFASKSPCFKKYPSSEPNEPVALATELCFDA